HPCLAVVRQLAPSGCVFFLSQSVSHGGEIGLSLVEQAIQANCRVVMGLRPKRSKPKCHVESRLAHAAIAFVIVVAQRHSPEWLTLFAVLCGLAELQLEAKANRVRIGFPSLRFYEIMISTVGMGKEKCCYVLVIAGLILQPFGDGAVAEVEIAGQPSRPRQVGLVHPELVVLGGVVIRAL